MSANGDSTTHFAALQERVHGLGQQFLQFEQTTTRAFQQVESALATLSAEVRAGGKTQWQTIVTSVGVIVAILGALGGLAYLPVKNGMEALGAELRILREAVVPRAEQAERWRRVAVSTSAAPVRCSGRSRRVRKAAGSAPVRAATSTAYGCMAAPSIASVPALATASGRPASIRRAMNSAIGDRHMFAWQTKRTSSTICTPLVGTVAAQSAATAFFRLSRPDAEGLPESYAPRRAPVRQAAPGAWT